MKKRFSALFLLLFCSAQAFSEEAVAANPYVRMSIQELMEMPVTSVSKNAAPLSRAASAIFVITDEDIRRSPATTIPDLLRTVPGLHVARTSANSWAVASRGFNGALSNKLLVLIDGRSVYTPLYAGVYWDVQDTMLENIDRIEVIRGPGATVWGANAVNGVINIITKNTKQTQGGKLKTVAGTEELLGAVSYGGQADANTSYRAYGKYFDRQDGSGGHDGWHQGRGGIRFDRDSDSENSFMTDVEWYSGETGVRGTDFSIRPPFRVTYLEDETQNGGHALWRWNHTEDAHTNSALQVYFDQTHRDNRIFEQRQYTVDVDWNRRAPIDDRNELTWGLGYRFLADDTAGDLSAAFNPRDEVDQIFSGFVQDEITLVPDTSWLTLGTKVEHNDYSQLEVQPSARVSWLLSARQTVWAAVSRAVRIPTRFDEHLALSGWTVDNVSMIRVLGDTGHESEEVLAYETGHRYQPNDKWSFDSALFFNHYENLTTYSAGTPFTPAGFAFTVVPAYVDDNMDGDTYGAEFSVQNQVTDEWKLTAGYTFLKMDLHSTNDLFAQENAAEGSNPKNQFSARSLLNLPHGFEFDAQVRYVDSLFALRTGAYVEMDLRLGWRPRPGTEIALVGQNLLDEHHVEFASDANPFASQVERSVYLKVTQDF